MKAIALAATLCFALPLPAQASAVNANALLHEGIAAPQHSSYVGQVENIRFGTHGMRAILVRVEHLAPNLTRRSFLAPESLFGNSIVLESDHLYEFDVHHHRVITSLRRDSDDPANMQNLALLMSNYRAVLGASNTIAGVKAQSISLLNRHTGEKAMTIWFDQTTHLIVGKEMFHKDGAVAYQMRFETLRYTTDIPRSVFSTTVPAGFVMTAREAQPTPQTSVQAAIKTVEFTPLEPHFLPEGFRFLSATQPTIHGVQMVHLLYSDGLRSVSIFENRKNAVANLNGYVPQAVKIGTTEGHMIAAGPTSLLTWRGNDNITFTLVGDLSNQELTKIAETLHL